MDESVAQSPEQQIITRASVTSAIPTTDHNDAYLGKSISSELLKSCKAKQIEIHGRSVSGNNIKPAV
uniref:Uncharacterized protein n=1 Tax=Wuchereria bancrofti TaxID=6293 RepID=A0A1I8EBI7_WUCBA